MNLRLRNFGQIQIDEVLYNKDVVINKGKISKRNKGKSRLLKFQYGHTPLTAEENIPWDCSELIIGTGFYGSLPVTGDVKKEAEIRGVKIKIMKTEDACHYLSSTTGANAVLHITC